MALFALTGIAAWRAHDRLRIETPLFASIGAVTVGFFLLVFWGLDLHVIPMLVSGLTCYGPCVFLVFAIPVLFSAETSSQGIGRLLALMALSWEAGALLDSGLWVIDSFLLPNPNIAGNATGFLFVALFFAFAVLTLRNLNLSNALGGLIAADHEKGNARQDEVGDARPDILLTRCAVAAERYQLTPRETEILKLLAQGRNGRVIQDRSSCPRIPCAPISAISIAS